MSAMWDNEKIKVFVKDALGCGCPEKVFEKIEVSRRLAAEHEKEVTRIVVGDTLLIYIIRPERTGNLVESAEVIGSAGKTDRDINSYNRFRLVVSGLEDDVQKGKLAERFSRLFKSDEKMHIHFVDQELIDALR